MHLESRKSCMQRSCVQLEHLNATKLPLVTLCNRVEEERGFLSVQTDPMNLKELNDELH